MPLLHLACTASPQLADDPVPPAYWGGTGAPALCPSPAVTAAELGFAARVWGARVDCSAPGAISVGVRDCDGDRLGEAWLDVSPAQVWLDPSAWEHRPEITVAHEVGHVLLGAEHAPASEPCHLMRPGLRDGCTYQAVAGRRYAVTP